MFAEPLKDLSRSHNLKTRALIQTSIERHTFLHARQREPSLKATEKSAGLFVTGENTALSKVISIFIQYCEKVKALFPPTQNHYHSGSPTLHKSQETHMLQPQLVQGIK